MNIRSLSILLLLSSFVDGSADVSFVAVSKTQEFAQFNPHIALLDVEEEDQDDPLSFEVFVQGSEEGSITSGVIEVGTDSNDLSADGESWYYRQRFENKADFDEAFPSASSYEITVVTPSDGANTMVLDLSADSYPNVPFITNWTALQAADPSGEITIEWQPFDGGTTDDHISVGINFEGPGAGGGILETPVPGEAGALNGTATSLSIPAGTLEQGKRYRANVSFYRIVGTGDGSVESAAAFGKQNQFRIVTTTDSDTTAPQLRYSNPENYGSDIPDDFLVMFEFDEAMDETVDLGEAIDWDGVDPATVSYSWSADGERLFCLFEGDLPLATTVQWVLNPEGAGGTPGMELADLSGNALFTRSGSFTTAETSNGFSGSSQWYFMIRAHYFRQNAGIVSPLEDFRTYAGVGMSSYNSLAYIAAVVGGDVLEIDGDRRDDRVEGSAYYVEEADHDFFFPTSGAYGFLFQPVESPTTSSLPLATLSGVFPEAPAVTNHLAAQAVDPSADFALSWNPVAGAGPDDFYIVIIDNSYDRSIFFTPLPGQTGSVVTETIPATATSVVIPAGTLPPGRTLELSLGFVSVDGRT
ncbi:MAG: Ig-like domain-containing protein, partial [Roseibacillus sp.]